ncbi:MAG: hypothetical protein VKN15_07160 [Cyanobacteriota bacterium]|nr:hypothetical protein [Cyanobacteriota bacterium]
MLPALPSPAAAAPAVRPGVLIRLVGLLLALLLPLTGCSGGAQPGQGVLLDALALQIQLTQGSIAQALALDPPGLPQVSRVRVEEQSRMTIGEASGLRLVGRFDWRLSGDPIRVDSPFELYLQRGERNQSWRLARPSGSTQADGRNVQEWTTYPLAIPGEQSRG